MPIDTRELFARLIQCEAGGEGDTGMRAVATVVMNRATINYGGFSRINEGGNVRNIIFQEQQFVCAAETVGGVYNAQNIYNMRPEAEHYAIAEWAVAGNRLDGLGYALWFFNPFSASCRPNFPSRVGEFVLRVGDHCFYNPTRYYADT